MMQANPLDRGISECLFELFLAETLQFYKETSDSQSDSLVYTRMESLGHQVGYALVEKVSKDKQRMIEPLDVVKFICKEFWIFVFHKQMDNLKTNYKGVFVLTDSKFLWTSRLSSQSTAETIAKSSPFLAFPCGLIQGALANLGLFCTVVADATALPLVTFQVKLTKDG